MGVFKKKKQDVSSQPSREELNKTVFKNKVALRNLEKKSTQMYEKELVIARQLKEKGLKSNSNYMRIGILYNVIQTIQMAFERLDSIASTSELNSIMSDLGTILNGVNSLDKKTAPGGEAKVLSEISEMHANAVKNEREYLRDYEKINKVFRKDPKDTIKMPSYDTAFIEKLIAGEELDNDISLPNDVVPIESADISFEEQLRILHDTLNNL